MNFMISSTLLAKKSHNSYLQKKSQGKSEPIISKKIMKPSIKMNKKESKCFIIMPWLSVVLFLDNLANKGLVVSGDWTTPYMYFKHQSLGYETQVENHTSWQSSFWNM